MDGDYSAFNPISSSSSSSTAGDQVVEKEEDEGNNFRQSLSIDNSNIFTKSSPVPNMWDKEYIGY